MGFNAKVNMAAGHDCIVADSSEEPDAAGAMPPAVSFREAMRHLASGVSIVAAGRDHDRAAIVATSVTSLSTDPPSLLVCVARHSSLSPVLQRHRHFSVSFLSAAQRPLAERFIATRSLDGGSSRFDVGTWRNLDSGAPALAGALANIDCAVEDLIERHTHTIVIGQALAAYAATGGAALTYWRGAFAALDGIDPPHVG